MVTRRVVRCIRKIDHLIKRDEIKEDSLLFIAWVEFKKEFHKQYKTTRRRKNNASAFSGEIRL